MTMTIIDDNDNQGRQSCMTMTNMAMTMTIMDDYDNDDHGWQSWMKMTIMDDNHGWQSWMTIMDDNDGWQSWMTI